MNFRQIIQDQKEELNQLKSRLLVPREAEERWIKPTRLVRIITGVRRSGKSTLALSHLLGSRFGYVNFDDERLGGIKAEELNEILTAVYEVYGEVSCFFFNEIQNAENWSLFVNRLQRAGNEIIITGSNSKLLSSELATHLTGRYKAIELFPFSFREFLLARNVRKEVETTKEKALRKSAFGDYLKLGGFPEILLGEDSLSYARDLFFSIINRDILYRHKIHNSRSFKEIAIFLALQTGKEISYNRLKNIFSLGSPHTAKNYVDHLEEAYLISTIGKFSHKQQESLRYRKSYVIDIAFFHALSGSGNADSGFTYETIVFLDLLRRRYAEGIELFYYKGIREVDFVIKRNRELTDLIQVCRDVTDIKTLNREVSALLEASEALKCEKLTVINENVDEERIFRGKKIRFIPIIDWLMKE
jgi:predicted AAA+ superfamily ATPase